MATPTFSINGGNNLPGVQANWQRVIKRKNTDGTIDYQNYALHAWSIARMEMDAYLDLVALNGQTLDSLATTDIDDRDNGATYSSAEILDVGGAQIGRRAVNVQVRFKVDIS